MSRARKLYVAGPMSNLPEFNYPAFSKASAQLREVGYAVLNPAENYGGYDGLTHAEYMRLDLQMVLLVDGLALLDGWENSRGAALEVHVAETLGIEVGDVGYWLAQVVNG